MPYKDPQKQKEYQRNHYEKNKELVLKRHELRREKARESAHNSILTGKILNLCLWNFWFNDKTKNVPYSIA
jgi:hypothetical protein